METEAPTLHKKSFFDYFPAPRFLKMSTVGLALSDDAIRIVEFLGRAQGFKLGRHGEVALERGVIRQGYIQNKKNLARVIRELKTRKKLSFVKASLPEEKGYVFTVRVPNLSYEEMKSSIEFKIEENAPVKLSEVIFDFNIIPDTRVSDGTVEVAVSVLPTDVVNTYVEALHEAGIEPIAFEVESQAIARAVVSRTERGMYLVVNLSPRKAGIYLVKRGIVVFTSTISFDEYNREGHSEEMFLLREIEKTLLFWETHLGDNIKQTEHATAVRIVGSHQNFNEMKQILSDELTVPVQVSNVWVNAFSFNNYVPDIKKKDSLKFAAAIGLALPVTHE